MYKRQKSRWQLQERPELTARALTEVEAVLDADLARLGSWLGMELTCAGWREQVAEKDPRWSVSAPAKRP